MTTVYPDHTPATKEEWIAEIHRQARKIRAKLVRIEIPALKDEQDEGFLETLYKFKQSIHQ